MPAIPIVVAGSIIASVFFGWNGWLSVKLIDTSEKVSSIGTAMNRLDHNFTEYIIKPALASRSKLEHVLEPLPISESVATTSAWTRQEREENRAPLVKGAGKGGTPVNE